MYCTRLAFSGLCRAGVSPKLSHQLLSRSRGYATDTGRTGLRRLRSKLGETSATSSQSGARTAISAGQGLLAGASALGVGALCYYGLGLSKEVGVIDKAVFWPDTVKQRVKATYGYFGASLGFTAATAVAISRNAALFQLVSRGGMIPLFVSIAAMFGTAMYLHSLPYTEGFGKKQLAWMAHSAVIGAVIAPLMILGGPLLTRAACYTAGMVGGLSTVAMCAPSEKFLNMGGPLAMGFGVVFMASIGSMFLPPTGALGASMYSVAVYGGLVLFGMFLLYDTQKIMKRAETTPTNSITPYDPINNAMGIYLDTVNIFIRIAMILAGGRKK